MDRDRFLATVRASLDDGATTSPPSMPEPYLPPLAPPVMELADQLTRELEAVGGIVYRASSYTDARTHTLRILQDREVRSVVRGNTADLLEVELDPSWQESGIAVTVCDELRGADAEARRQAALAADAGICSVDFGIAETGTLVLLARPGQDRSISLLPPIHIAILDARCIVQELGALLIDEIDSYGISSAVTLITGPSRTGDIELVLTVGVHGPGELHLVLIDPP